MNDIARICQKYGLSSDELRSLLAETDAGRGLLTPSDLEAGLSSVLNVYLGALQGAAERVADPSERMIVDRFLAQAMEGLAAQLEGASHRRN